MPDPSKANDQHGLTAVLSALAEVNRRLDRLEGNSEQRPLNSPQGPHPSTDKFSVAEAIADSIFSSMKEKACQFEPDKPCDHCSMCNSRGF